MALAAPDAPPRGAPPDAQSGRLPRRVLLAYGAGDVGGAVITTISGFYLAAYWLDVARLPAAYMGTILLVAQVWDAVTDPAVGIAADRTRTRWGRKRPWLLFGAVPFALAYVLQWTVPDLGPVGLFWWFLAAALLLRTFLTVVGIPYSALTPDLTPDYDERTRLNQYRFTFNLVASLVAISLHPVLVELGGGGEGGYLLSAGVFAFAIAGGLLVTFRYTYEIPVPPPTETLGEAVRALREPFRSRPFRFTVGLFILSWTAVLLVQANLLLFVRYWLEAEAHFVGVILAFQVTAIVFLAVWGKVSERAGKTRTYVYGAVLWMGALLSLYVLPPDTIWPYYVAASLAGAGAAVAYLVPWSLLPDVVDEDAARTGTRRESTYYAVFVLLQKAGLSVSLAGSAFALGLAGYVNPEEAGGVAEQPEAVLQVLRLVVSVVPALALLASLPLALRFPLASERAAALDAAPVGAESVAGGAPPRPSPGLRS